ncbi:MAG TPA: sulfatase [Chloroflexota bacterium]|jgi:arylsulfatase A-like enzyme
MPTGQPSVLVITCHDLGRHLGCYGVPTLRTPNLDRLAAQGVRFAQAYCAAPQCSPSRAALYTGRHPHSNGVLGLTHANFGFDLQPEERHLAQILKESGRATALVGADHEIRHVDDASAAARLGFDHLERPRRGDAIAAAALAQLERFAEGRTPFYLQVGFNEPHRLAHPDPAAEPDYMGFRSDYVEPDDRLGLTVPPWLRDTPAGRAEIAELQGAVHYVDRAIGRLLDRLDELGLADETLVVYTPDHGLALPRAKCSLYGPGLEVALLVRYPDRGWAGGRVQAELISNVDVFPTILEALGLAVPPSVQGRSFAPLLDGRPYAAREAIFGEMTYHDYYDPRRCVRTASHHLIVNFTAAPAFMNPSQSWRPRTDPLVPPKPALAYHPLVELFDLVRDPHEQVDVAGQPAYAAVQADLLARLHAWMRQTDDPLLEGAVTPPMHRWALRALAGQGVPSTTTPPVA